MEMGIGQTLIDTILLQGSQSVMNRSHVGFKLGLAAWWE